MHTERRARVKAFKDKLQEAWGFAKPSNLCLTSQTDPLEQWITPREVTLNSAPQLNWSAWLKNDHATVGAQANALTRLRGPVAGAPSFFLWRHVGERHGRLDHARCKRVDDREARVAQWASILADQRVSQLLRDEWRGDERRLLVDGLYTANEKLNGARHVYQLRSDDAVAVVGDNQALRTSFYSFADARSVLQAKLSALGLQEEDVVLIDVFLGNRCARRRTATVLLDHLFACHPNTLCVVHCPPVLSTLRFYESMGFSYSDMQRDNLLPHVIDKIERAVCAWHSGCTSLSYARPYIEDTRPRISMYDGTDADLDATYNDLAQTLDEDTRARVGMTIVEPGDRIDVGDEPVTWLWVRSFDDVRRVLRAAGRSIAFNIDKTVHVVVPAAWSDGASAILDQLPIVEPQLCVLESPVMEADVPVLDGEEKEDEDEEDSSPAAVAPLMQQAGGEGEEEEWEEEDALLGPPTGAPAAAPLAQQVGQEEEDESYVPFGPPTGAPAAAPLAQQVGQEEEDESYVPFPGGTSDLSSEDDDVEADAQLFRYYQKRNGDLHLQRVAEAVGFTIAQRGLRRREVTVDMRAVLSELVQIELGRGDKGVVFVSDQNLTHVCVYRLEAGSCICKHLILSGEVHNDTLFALSVRLHHPSVQLTDATTYETSLFVDETVQNLFQRAISTEEQQAFVRSCLRNTPSKRVISVCRSPHKPPVGRW